MPTWAGVECSERTRKRISIEVTMLMARLAEAVHAAIRRSTESPRTNRSPSAMAARNGTRCVLADSSRGSGVRISTRDSTLTA